MNNYYRPFGRFSVLPPVIKNLLIINAAVFFLQILGNSFIVSDGYTLYEVITKYFALIPIDGIVVGRMAGEPVVWNFYPWQLITYQFLHGDFWHIFFNMFFGLWMFGMEIENIWGSRKFLVFYLTCGVFAGLVQLFISPVIDPVVGPTIGASGAVYGVLIAFALMFPDRSVYLYFLFPVKVKYLVGFLIILGVMSIGGPGNVAHLAHLGGAIAGFVFIMLDKRIDVPLKRMLNRKYGGSNRQFDSPFNGLSERFKKRSQEIQDAKYYDLNKKEDKEEITQEQIDKILDKISQSGYQNLTEKEKKILFEASKKMS